MKRIIVFVIELVKDLACGLTTSGRNDCLTDCEPRTNCNWCGYRLEVEQTKPTLCSACYRRYLVGLTKDASNEDVDSAEKHFEIWA